MTADKIAGLPAVIDRRYSRSQMIGLLVAIVVSANQGSAVELSFPSEPGVKSVEIIWNNKRVPAFQIEDRWTTILGVDLDAKPGKHPADARFTMQDGSV